MIIKSGTRVVRYPANLPLNQQSTGAECSSLNDSKSKVITQSSVVTFGNYDGLHRGHVSLLKKVKHEAELLNAQSVLLSLYPHPRQVITGVKTPSITSLGVKLEMLSSLKIDQLYLLHFTRNIQELSPERFLSDILIAKLNPSKVIVGSDAAVGKNRAGNVDFMHKFFAEHQIAFEVFPFTVNAGEKDKISSSMIRNSLETGNLSEINDLLGRRFSICSRVKHGDQRGRQIGFPTANMTPTSQLLPKNGVYITESNINGENYKSISNIGIRPTFSGSKVILETHLIDYSGLEFYGKKLKVNFIKRIRDEQKFDSLTELKLQIEKDLQFAKEHRHE